MSEELEERIDLLGVGEDSVDALGVEGGERDLPELIELDGAVGRDVGLEKLKEADLVGVQAGVLLDEGLEVFVDLGRVHADDAADGKGEAFRFVRIVFEEVLEIEARVLKEDVRDEFLKIRLGDRFA